MFKNHNTDLIKESQIEIKNENSDEIKNNTSIEIKKEPNSQDIKKLGCDMQKQLSCDIKNETLFSESETEINTNKKDDLVIEEQRVSEIKEKIVHGEIVSAATDLKIESSNKIDKELNTELKQNRNNAVIKELNESTGVFNTCSEEVQATDIQKKSYPVIEENKDINTKEIHDIKLQNESNTELKSELKVNNIQESFSKIEKANFSQLEEGPKTEKKQIYNLNTKESNDIEIIDATKCEIEKEKVGKVKYSQNVEEVKALDVEIKYDQDVDVRKQSYPKINEDQQPSVKHRIECEISESTSDQQEEDSLQNCKKTISLVFKEKPLAL
ncbi:hypothetical protein CDIK_4282, partial [Cucumispora dikerogammari]